MEENLSKLVTEQENIKTKNIDEKTTLEVLQLINEEDALVHQAVRDVLPQIAVAVDKIAESFKKGGRLIYAGAGTSGRLGVLDASECPPTFGTEPGQVSGILAGGTKALVSAVEGAEDSIAVGGRDVKKCRLSENDILVGITASGRTPYVLGAVTEAKKCGCYTIGIANNPGSPLEKICDTAIVPITGPEVVTGSTRMKAGTSQKLVLNMLTTASMIKTGKVYGNLMVDVKPTNLKLDNRAARIVARATGTDVEEAARYLQKAGMSAKVAIIMIKTGKERIDAEDLLAKAGGFISRALDL